MGFIDGSPDPFHVTDNLGKRLKGAGFTEINERDPWSGLLKPGGRYYYARDRTTFVAFTVGEKYQPGNGFKVLGAHTDSPNLKLKPRSQRDGKKGKNGCLQLDVQVFFFGSSSNPNPNPNPSQVIFFGSSY